MSPKPSRKPTKKLLQIAASMYAPTGKPTAATSPKTQRLDPAKVEPQQHADSPKS